MFGIGEAIGGWFGYKGQQDANQANAEIARERNEFEAVEAGKARGFSKREAEINRQWQQRMSSSAVSRRMKDMKGAGINPILAGKYDASTPAGAMPSTAKANAHGYDHKSELGAAVQSAVALASNIASIRHLNAQTKNIEQNLNIKSPAEKIMSQGKKALDQGETYIRRAAEGTAATAIDVKSRWQKAERKVTDIINKRLHGNVKKRKYKLKANINKFADEVR